MPAAEIVRAHLDAAQEDRRLIVESHARSARLLVAQEVLSHVAVRNDLRHVDERRVATGMVGVMVRVEQILDRHGADALHLLQDVRHVVLILVVNQDQSF